MVVDEDEKLANIFIAKVRGQKTERILCDTAPITVPELMKYTRERLEQLLLVLVDLEFAPPLDMSKYNHIPFDDQRQHIAEACLDGLRTYDAHYRRGRFDSQGKARKSLTTR